MASKLRDIRLNNHYVSIFLQNIEINIFEDTLIVLLKELQEKCSIKHQYNWKKTTRIKLSKQVL